MGGRLSTPQHTCLQLGSLEQLNSRYSLQHVFPALQVPCTTMDFCSTSHTQAQTCTRISNNQMIASMTSFLEAQQQYSSYRTILVALVSQKLFCAFFYGDVAQLSRWYRSIAWHGATKTSLAQQIRLQRLAREWTIESGRSRGHLLAQPPLASRCCRFLRCCCCCTWKAQPRWQCHLSDIHRERWPWWPKWRILVAYTPDYTTLTKQRP